jgi:hypothetical protein
VLRCSSEYHGECWSLSNQEAARLAWVIKGMLYISVTCLLVSHLCDLVASGAVCSLLRCNGEYLHGECCWSLSNQEAAKLAWVIKGMLQSVLHAFW